MLLHFVSKKTKCNALLKRIVALGSNAEIETYDLPMAEGKKQVSFARLHVLKGDVPTEIAIKALEWAKTCTDGTWAKVTSGPHYDAMLKLSGDPDAIVDANM